MCELAYFVHCTRFNCTFMELKSPTRRTFSPRRACFNCTFMELKYKKYNEGSLEGGVLIVPLWN